MRLQLFGLFFCILVLHGQTPLGTVSGLAVDASGGAVAAASVTLTNNDTGVRRTATTNTSGAYAFPDLPPGTYRLGADAKGFRPIETRAFAVEAYRTVRQDFKFEIASTSTEVVVTEAASAVVQLESPAVGSSLAPAADHRDAHQPAQRLQEFRRFRTHLEHPTVDRPRRRPGGQWREVAHARRRRHQRQGESRRHRNHVRQFRQPR